MSKTIKRKVDKQRSDAEAIALKRFEARLRKYKAVFNGLCAEPFRKRARLAWCILIAKKIP